MKIKNFFTAMILGTCIAVAAPVQSFAVTTNTVNTADPEKDAATLARVTARVNEIRAMDLENLSASDKKALRKELKGLHKDASGLDSKVYLSVGAIIIIILLLILILR